MARRTRSVRRRRSRRGGMFGKNPLSSNAPVMPVPRSVYDEQAKARSKAFSATIRNNNNQAEAEFLGRNKLPGAESAYQGAENSQADLATAQLGEINADKKIKQIKEGTHGYFNPGEEGPQQAGKRRTRRRRGGADKRALVDAILAAIVTATENPDKLQLLKAAVAPVEPPELKAEVADAAKEETPEEGLAKITASLMKLDEVKLMSLKTALESVPKEGGDATEDLEMQKRREQRIAESRARIAEANRPLGERAKAAIRSSGEAAKSALYAALFVLAGAVSSTVGNARRRRTRRA